MVESFTFLVLYSQPDFRSNNGRLQFTDCCSQSRPNWHHYQILQFGGDVVGLSVATHYGASKCCAPTHNHNQIPFVMVSWWDYASEHGFEPSCHFADFFFLDPQMRIIKSALRNLIVEEDCCFMAPKPIKTSPCSKPCQLIILSESFQGCLSVAHFRQPWAKVKVPC
jgi:hypothetical protein